MQACVRQLLYFIKIHATEPSLFSPLSLYANQQNSARLPPGNVSFPLKTSPDFLLDPDTDRAALFVFCLSRSRQHTAAPSKGNAAWRLKRKSFTFSPCRARRKVGPPSFLFSFLSLFSPPCSPTSPIPQLDTVHVCVERHD